MNITTNTFRRVCHLAAGFALGIATASLAVADDTEVLVGNQLNPGDPNITFIIDTSGSMDSEVVVGLDYDPLETYEGNCDINRIYWTLEGTGTITLPDCVFNKYVERTAYQCFSGVRTISRSGQFRDRHAQWDVSLEPSVWDTVTRATSSPDTNGAIRLTDCAADAGLHGDVAGDFYPADGAAGPWTTDPDLGIDWDTTGDLYTFFSGNYLNWIQEAGKETTVASRIEVVQRVAQDVLTPLNGVNLALMRFSTNAEGGMVLHEMAPIAQGRDDIITAINSVSPQGSTPLAETLYEAGQYYAGRDVDFGVNSVGDNGAALPSVPASQNNGDYISPITRQCQRNYIVLLTDGLPVGDTDADASMDELPGFDGPCDGNCLDEMAIYLDQVDQRHGGLPGPQTVQTYTIGFHTDQSLLEDAATGRVAQVNADGDPIFDDNGEPLTRPGYFIANDQEQLTAAFENILATIQTDGESFTAPAISIDVQNRLTNRDDLYFAMFQPPTRGQPHWDGNLKKYRIGRSAGDATGGLTIIDAAGQAAVDANGVFLAGAKSFWSLQPDGSDVGSGGFTSTLSANRNIYSNVTNGTLTAASNQVHESNGALTAAMLQVDPTDRDSLLRWARGLNIDGTVRPVIGDPLHSQPVFLAYSGDRFALFFGTNDGMLHAIDPESTFPGAQDLEHFAFIPRELLPQLDRLKRNAPQAQHSAQKAYGLDGPITLWIDETNNNGIVEGSEDAYLYIGMRRGGRNYYALDVSDVSNPELVWSIIGGTGDFVELGQSWSAPISSRVRWDGTEKQVLFFAGGNDTNQDARDRPAAADDMGRAIYMVDALTGQRLWWASIRDEADLTLTDMTHSIPSDLRVIDINQDGLDDRIYVGDTSGKVWRFDINNGDGSIAGAVFADLGDTGESGNRRIYSAPSVTRIFSQDSDSGTFLTVSVGTGHRAHPLERDVADGFYMMRDVNVFAPPVNASQQITYPDPVVPADLLDVTNNISPTADDLSKGWFIDFDDSEKSLSEPVSVLDRIFFTTYLPLPPDTTCEPLPVIGNGRLYSVNILSGAPLVQADSPTPGDRYTDLDRLGIPPKPTLVFTPPTCTDCDSDTPVSEITMLVGTEALDPGINNVPLKTYWVQEDIDR